MPLKTVEHGSHGAQRLDAHHTRFTLWAPDAFYVSLELRDGRSLPLIPQADGWFALEIPCPAGTRYRFNIDGELEVPDPASRAQDGGLAGWSVVVDPRDYHWRHPHWKGRPWQEAVIYEVHVGAMGGYANVARHLPRLAEMGVTAIELMPLAQCQGQRNWGYDGALLYAPHDSYGSPQALKQLIDDAHGLGLMVMLDVVYNHFGPEGNYLSRYASPFFRKDSHTPWGAAIDYQRPPVRDFFIDNALMWLLEYRFDGLRLDAVHAIDDPAFLHQLAHQVRRHTAPDRHVWLTLENEFNQAGLLEKSFDAQWNDDGHNTLHVLLTGETDAYYAEFADNPTQKLARCLSQGFVFQGEDNRHGMARGEPSGHLPPSAFVLFLQNHDQIGNRAAGERLHHLCAPQALRAATALLLLSPMIPLFFMGDESAAPEPFLFFTDYSGELADAVREGRRKEFAEFSTFASPDAHSTVADPNAPETFARSRPDFRVPERGPRREMLTLYQHLLALRQQQIVPRLEGSQALGSKVLAEGAVTASWRLGDASVLHITVNLSGQSVPFVAPLAQPVLFQTPPDMTLDVQQHQRLVPYSALVSLVPPPTLSPLMESAHE